MPPTVQPPKPLPVKALRRRCSPVSLGFASTDELPDLQNVIGQPRALRALEMGSELSGPGYNIFVLGMPGSGRTTLSQEYLQRKAADESVPDDWCYVNNFENPHQPRALRLPAGRAVELRKDIADFVGHCQQDIPRILESEEYTHERDRIMSELKKRQEAEFIKLQEYVEKYNFMIARTSFGFMLAPAVQGKPIKQEELEALTPEQREKLEQLQAKLSEDVEKTIKLLREMESKASEDLIELNSRTILYLIRPLIDAIKERYAGLDQVQSYLDAIQADIVMFARQMGSAADGESPADGAAQAAEIFETRYVINVLVDNSATHGAPVILESHPSYYNLLGRIEHEVMMGATHTDFTMIRPGALHRANGGYLVLPARDVLMTPYAWEGLQRAMRDSEVRIIELGNQLSLLSTTTLEPEPIPLQVKVVLVGTPLLYYLLRMYDEDFSKLFKVRAEFATVMERTPQTEREYGLFVKSVVMDHNLPPFDRRAVAEIVEYSARLAEDQDKLSTRFGMIADLVREAAYWAKKNGFKKRVTAVDVKRAVQESIYRSNLIEERIQELIADGTFRIDVDAATVGQINALSVMMLGDYEFGRPSRLTASAYPGKGGVVDIERQAKLGGPIHTKGVLILNGLLGRLYGRSQPLTLSANLTFEQSYEGVDGDSASTAEMLVLLSAIAQVPLRQDLAITGSIDQQGFIQAIGGVNEKIEGFFAVCKARGLTGGQGVAIPATNVRNLMLRDEVVDAVKQGQFHIWPISTLDEALALFTGWNVAPLQADGKYPEGTFHHVVAAHLAEFARVLESQGGNHSGARKNGDGSS